MYSSAAMLRSAQGIAWAVSRYPVRVYGLRGSRVGCKSIAGKDLALLIIIYVLPKVIA